MSLLFKGRVYYRTAEACRFAGISKNTFLRWVKQGTLPDVITRDGRDWRLFTKEDVAHLKAQASEFGTPRIHSRQSKDS